MSWPKPNSTLTPTSFTSYCDFTTSESTGHRNGPWQLQALPIVGVVNRWCGQLPTRTTRARTTAEFRFGQLPVRESAGENEIDCGINSSSSRSCAAGVALDAGTERRYGTPAWIASTDRWSGTATLVRDDNSVDADRSVLAGWTKPATCTTVWTCSRRPGHRTQTCLHR